MPLETPEEAVNEAVRTDPLARAVKNTWPHLMARVSATRIMTEIASFFGSDRNVAVIQRYPRAYMAYFKSNPAVWGFGIDPNSAMGVLIANYPKLFQRLVRL